MPNARQELPNELLRLYAPELECGSDGYPYAWHESIKHEVRAAAGHRCERCGHPYKNGEHGRGEWSECDELCTHDGPVRVLVPYEDEPETPPEWFETVALMPVGELIRSSNGQTHEAKWRVLTVHHLDGIKSNCRWWNLAALCQRCHLVIQGRVNLAQVYAFEHSEWFKPHAAGYYALTYLGLELTQSETLARLDEILALERVG